MEKREQRIIKEDGSEYQITIEGIVEETWSDWFLGMEIIPHQDKKGNVVTTLRGLVSDQAALRGLLVKLWDLNATIIGVNRIDT